MYLGRSAGSGQPLVWAHAEYLKLLRSVVDGQVFDCLPVVEERYLRQHPEHTVEIFKLDRKIKRIAAGKTLRILAFARFRVVWSDDNWQTVNTLEAKHAGFPGCFADIAVRPQQQVPLQFTLYWPTEDRWENENFTVEVDAAAPGELKSSPGASPDASHPRQKSASL